MTRKEVKGEYKAAETMYGTILRTAKAMPRDWLLAHAQLVYEDLQRADDMRKRAALKITEGI